MLNLMKDKTSFEKPLIFYFVLFFIIISILFAFCFFEAYGFEDGTTKTESARIKFEIMGYLTFFNRQIGDMFFSNSRIYASLFLPFSVFIDSLICSLFAKAIINLLLKIKFKKQN